MKKLLFTCLLLLAAVVGRAEGTSDVIQVQNAQELIDAIRDHSSATIQLKNIIYLDGTTYDSRDFSGILDGQGYTIFSGDKELFNKLRGATIQNATFSSFTIERIATGTVNTSTASDRGIVARETTENTVISNVAINNSKILIHGAYGFARGCVVGRAANTRFEDITVSGCNILALGSGVGGVAGFSQDCTFSNCVVSDGTTLYATGDDGTSVNSQVGGLVGMAKNTEISNCTNRGLVSGGKRQIGGLVGLAYDNSRITNCINSGLVISIGSETNYETLRTDYLNNNFVRNTVKYGVNTYTVQTLPGNYSIELIGHIAVGGIVGEVNIVDKTKGAEISTCVNLGAYYSEGGGVGGIVGYGNAVSIYNCLTTPSAYDPWPLKAQHGGIIGYVYEVKTGNDHDSNIYGCLCLNNSRLVGDHSQGNDFAASKIMGSHNFANADAGGHFQMLASAEMIQKGNVAYWLNLCSVNRNSAEPVWRQNLTGDNIDAFPVLLQDHHVVTLDDELANKVTISGSRELEAFIKMPSPKIGVLTHDFNTSGYQWETGVFPIGTKDNPFLDIFDGQGHTIDGIKISVEETSDGYLGAGLFGNVGKYADISNLIIGPNSEIKNYKETGAAGIVGTLYGDHCEMAEVHISNCGSYASVSTSKHGGGILGRVRTEDTCNDANLKVYVEDCFNMGTITVSEGNSGLLCGYTKNHATVRNCWSAGYLKMLPGSDVAPFEGTHSEYFVGYGDNLTIENCFAVVDAGNVDKLGESTNQAGVSRISSSNLASGELTHGLNSSLEGSPSTPYKWQQNIGTDQYPSLGNKGLYHTRKVNNEYGTVCLPFALASTDNIRLYTFVEFIADDGNIALNFKYEPSIAAGTPALFRVANPGQNYTFCDAGNVWVSNPVDPGNGPWKMYGTFVDYEANGNIASSVYYISNNEIRNSKDTKIAAYRAYIWGTDFNLLLQDNPAPTVSIVLDGEVNTEGLQLVIDDNMRAQYDKNYTLFGSEASNDYHGLMIRGGKKVFVK